MPTTTNHRPLDQIKQDESVKNECEVIPLFPQQDNAPKRHSRSDINYGYQKPIRELLDGKPDAEIQTFRKERDHLLSEMIFLKNRDASVDHSAERMEACDLIAADILSFEEVLSLTDPEENRRLYDQISILRTIYVNQLITLDHLAGEDFENQRGLARIELMRFLLRKTDLCYRKGIELNNKNFDDLFLTDTELRLDKIQQDIRQLLNEAFAIAADDPKALEEFKAEVTALTKESKAQEATLPTKAPERYKDREDRSMKPVEFIEKVYGEWLGKGLLRPHIKALDEPLYRALYKHGIPKSFEDRLPKSAGKLGRPRESLSEDALERRRASDRERSRRLYQKRKQQSTLS